MTVNSNAFNAHDLDAIMEFFADDCSLDMPRGPDPWGHRFTGKAVVREALRADSKACPTGVRCACADVTTGSFGTAKSSARTPTGRSSRSRRSAHLALSFTSSNGAEKA